MIQEGLGFLRQITLGVDETEPGAVGLSCGARCVAFVECFGGMWAFAVVFPEVFVPGSEGIPFGDTE